MQLGLARAAAAVASNFVLIKEFSQEHGSPVNIMRQASDYAASTRNVYSASVTQVSATWRQERVPRGGVTDLPAGRPHSVVVQRRPYLEKGYGIVQCHCHTSPVQGAPGIVLLQCHVGVALVRARFV